MLSFNDIMPSQIGGKPYNFNKYKKHYKPSFNKDMSVDIPNKFSSPQKHTFSHYSPSQSKTDSETKVPINVNVDTETHVDNNAFEKTKQKAFNKSFNNPQKPIVKVETKEESYVKPETKQREERNERNEREERNDRNDREFDSDSESETLEKKINNMNVKEIEDSLSLKSMKPIVDSESSSVKSIKPPRPSFKKHQNKSSIVKPASREDNRNTINSILTPIEKFNKINVPVPDIPEQVRSTVYPVQEVMYEMPRMENRFITVGENPYQDISRLNFLYEDFIPEPLMPNKISSISDRLSLGDFISKNVFGLYESEGDKVYMGHAKKNIVEGLHKSDREGLSKIWSKMKEMKENPNIINRLNPDGVVPSGFRIFNTCYPIRKTDSGVSCSKTSQTVNLRIYHTPFEINEKDTCKVIDRDGKEQTVECASIIDNNDDDMHINRELDYLMSVNDIIVNKESPNFPLCYGIVKQIYDNRVKFTKAGKDIEVDITNKSEKSPNDIQMENMIKYAYDAYDYIYDMIIKNNDGINKELVKKQIDELKKGIKDREVDYKEIENMKSNSQDVLNAKMLLIKRMQLYLKVLFNKFNFGDFEKWKIERKTGEKEENDKKVKMMNELRELVSVRKEELDKVISFAVSEAPDYSFDEWTNPQTIRQFGVAKMIESGWHTDEEKEIFLFELLYAFITILKHKIYIPNFTKDNIFIKKVLSEFMMNKLFIYSLDGINYYIPNKGFYVMIDERYACLKDNINKDKIGKVRMPYTKDKKNNVMYGADDECMKDMITSMKNIIADLNKDGWFKDKKFDDKNFIKYDDDSKEFIDRLRDLLIFNFGSYANNRCGTILSAEEHRYLNGAIKQLIDYECGELVLESVDNDTRYKIVQIVSREDKTSAKVFVQTIGMNKKPVIEEKNISDLYAVKNNSMFRQIKDKYNRVDENFIDTYELKTSDK